MKYLSPCFINSLVYDFFIFSGHGHIADSCIHLFLREHAPGGLSGVPWQAAAIPQGPYSIQSLYFSKSFWQAMSEAWKASSKEAP